MTQISKEVICPKCLKGNKINMLVNICNNLNPEFKERILREDLFDWECEHCKYVAQLSYPLMFSDHQRQYVICLTPRAGKADSIKSNSQLENYTKRRVKSLAELKEKILIFDVGFDDLAIELVKNALVSVVKNSYNVDKVKMYFSKVNEDESIEFAVFFVGKKEPWYQSAKISIYNQSCEVIRTLDYKEENEFIRVGPTLASKLLAKYKEI
ncbi:MAG: CpXC domain-containing protein [Clostridia bacterium]